MSKCCQGVGSKKQRRCVVVEGGIIYTPMYIGNIEENKNRYKSLENKARKFISRVLRVSAVERLDE